MKKRVLGVRVDDFKRTETMTNVEAMMEEKKYNCKLLVTAYSEFFVKAQKDKKFREIIEKAELVTADGVSVWSALRYTNLVSGSKNPLLNFLSGLRVGSEILGGMMPKNVSGVWLFDQITRKAFKRHWKVFLLGGWNGVAGRVAERLSGQFPGLVVEWDEGERMVGTDQSKNEEVIKKINKLKPDVLFVAYNPVKQEKWIAENKNRLKVGVAMGVGGTFNEYLGEFPKAPKWMERMGLKWLWRVIIEPKRFGRVWNAVVVFAWGVYRESW